VEPVYEKLPGWKKSTEGAASFDELPKKAQEYLRFIERESGAKIGMVSTGPDRDQTMLLPEFEAEIIGSAEKAAAPVKGAKAK
jgi:adenylosuccinate synthase